MTSRPEPLAVNGPSCSMLNVKMVGNITELNRPTRMMLPIATPPVVATEVHTNADAIMAALPSTLPGDILRVPPPVNEFTDVWQRYAHGLRENESIKRQQEPVSG